MDCVTLQNWLGNICHLVHNEEQNAKQLSSKANNSSTRVKSVQITVTDYSFEEKAGDQKFWYLCKALMAKRGVKRIELLIYLQRNIYRIGRTISTFDGQMCDI